MVKQHSLLGVNTGNRLMLMSSIKKFPENQPGRIQIPGRNANQLIDLLPSSISIQDSELRILFCNQNFKKNFGDAIGKLCYRVYKGTNNACPF